MAQEIERKFLVKGDFKSQSTKSTRITQGYLSSIPEEQYVLELKGIKGILRLKVLVMQAEPNLVVDPCRCTTLPRYFYRWVDTGCQSQRAVYRSLEYGEAIKENLYYRDLSRGIIHHYGYFGNDCCHRYGTGYCYRKLVSAVCSGHRLPGDIYYRK